MAHGRGPGLDGSRFIAVQRRVRELARFEAMATEQQDLCIGRHHIGNAQIDDAPRPPT